MKNDNGHVFAFGLEIENLSPERQLNLKTKIENMNKSTINVPSAGTKADSSTTAENQQVSQPNANTNVVRQGGDKRDTYATGFKRALQIVGMQVDNKIYKTKKRNPTPNTLPQVYSDGYLKALNHIKDLIESRLKNLDDGKQVW